MKDIRAATGQQMFTAIFGAMYHAAPNKEIGHISVLFYASSGNKICPGWLLGACPV